MMMADATVLVVDDEPELLEIFSIWVNRYGATVLKATNGAEALAILKTRKVDAMISDMRMPVMDGVTLVRSLHDLNLTIPTIIFVSGFGDVSPRILYSLGVEAMLPKPLARNQLLQTLEASLRERKDLWLSPLTEPAENELSLDFPSLDEAVRENQFALGRGGCCVHLPRTMPEGLLDFHLRFLDEGITLRGQGCVRWYDPHTKHAGIEFLYLEESARTWVFDYLQQTGTQSFIPFC